MNRFPWASSCAGKERHVSEAARAVSALGRGSLEPYACDYCGGWHLATQRGMTHRSYDNGRGEPFERLRHHRRPRRRRPRR